MIDLAVKLNGLRLPNPFIIASGPPGTNANVIAKAFDEGWGGVVSKTACLDAARIVNVSPRYSRLRAGDAGSRLSQSADGRIVGWENIELISDRPFTSWLSDFKRLKERYPDRVLIASITEECSRDAWIEIVERTQATGVDALELNFSCPHGLPERRMGSAIGQDPELIAEITRWVMSAARVPVWAKLTPNITDISVPARAAFGAGCAGVSAINTILSVMSVNLDTLRPEPTVEGHSTAGGYSGAAVRPIALRMTSQIAQMIENEFGGSSSGSHAHTLSAIGGVESGDDAAQFILLGASSVQVCTGVMIHGYKLIHTLKQQLTAFMARHAFESIEEFRGRSLAYLTTHADLVRRQAEARRIDRASAEQTTHGPVIVRGDQDWSGDRFVEQSAKL